MTSKDTKRSSPNGEPEDESHSGVNELANESEKIRGRLERHLFNRGFEQFSAINYNFIVFTGSITDRLVYAPITNIGYKAIQESISQFNPDGLNGSLLDVIRNAFPLELDQDSSITRICRVLSKSQDLPDCILVPVSEGTFDSGRAFEVGKRKFKKATSKTETQVRKLIGNYDTAGDDFNKVATALRGAIDRRLFFLLLSNVRNDFEQLEPLVQLGLVLADKVSDIDYYGGIRPALATSLYSTLTLLLERRRYFEKALRQVVRGTIVKVDDVADIRGQIGILESLGQNRSKNLVPAVMAQYEPDPLEKPFGLSWYRMSKFESASLMSILTATPGLERFEVSALARACFQHLRNTYWQRLKPGVNKQPSIPLLTALFVAGDQIVRANKLIKDRFDQLIFRNPVRKGREFKIPQADISSSYSELIEKVIGGNEHFGELVFEWNGRAFGSRNLVSDPLVDLRQLATPLVGMLKENFQQPSATIPEIDSTTGMLHGDFHFANILVDASIPEDALVASIDPAVVAEPTDGFYRSLVGGMTKQEAATIQGTESDIRERGKEIKADPAYDIAKMMLSSSGCYSLIYSSAFELEVDGKKCTIKSSSLSVPKNLAGTGGISGAGVISYLPSVVGESLENHRIATEQILLEFVESIGEAVSEQQAAKSSAAISIILVWFYTIRHMFSISEKYFPEDVKKSLLMYLFGVRFIAVGKETINQALHDCNSASIGDHLDGLLSIFDIVKFEND